MAEQTLKVQNVALLRKGIQSPSNTELLAKDILVIFQNLNIIFPVIGFSFRTFRYVIRLTEWLCAFLLYMQ